MIQTNLQWIQREWRKWIDTPRAREISKSGNYKLGTEHVAKLFAAYCLDSLHAESCGYPKPCGICTGVIQSKDDLDWHGYGNCRDIPDIVLAELNIAGLLRDLQGHVAGELGERLDRAVAALAQPGKEEPRKP